jgi:hypothetical protein
MAKFLYVYHGGGMGETEAARAATMKAWDDWFHELGAALVDGGNPGAATRVVASDGSVTDGGPTSPTGYTTISASSHDEAVRLARGCPVLAGGGMVEVTALLDM